MGRVVAIGGGELDTTHGINKYIVELSPKHIDHSIRVELDLDEFDETPSELRKKATYREIRNYVLRSTESRLQHLPYLK